MNGEKIKRKQIYRDRIEIVGGDCSHSKDPQQDGEAKPDFVGCM